MSPRTLTRHLAAGLSVLMIALAALFLGAAAASANSISDLAADNLGKGPCSTNSLGGIGFENSCSGEAWCADFAKWVWAHSGADVNGLTAAAGSFPEYGGLKKYPQVGDAVIFNYNGNGYADHMAIVTSINSNGTITSIGGNERGGAGTVAQDTYSPSVGWSSYWGMTLSGYVSPHHTSIGFDMANYASGQNYCLDADDSAGYLYNGAKVQVWTCNGRDNQNWHFNGTELVNGDTANGVFCLDANANAIGNGDKVQVWNCNGRSNQQWYSTTNLDSPNGWRALSNGANRNLCLDANTTSLYNGDKVQLWNCNNQVNQAWTLV